MAKWYLVRHGETEWNAQRRVQGQADTPMHDGGRDQAARTAARLAELRFIAVYASDLSRTRETARIILAAQGDDPPEVQVRQALREISYGVLEGMTSDEIRKADIEVHRRMRAHDLDYAPRRGESFRALMERLGGFARELEANHGQEDVLVVGHGGSLRALAVMLLDLQPEAFWRIRGLSSASISIVTRDDGYSSLTTWNDTGHLL